jgi:DNA recombination protein RmuC
MPIGNAPLLGVVAALAVGIVVLTLLLLRRRPPTADPTLLALQQQVTRLSEEIARLGAQVPKEVGQSLHTVVAQVGARLSENTSTLQKSAADTGRLIADISHRLGQIDESSRKILDLGQDIRGLQQIFQAPKVRGGLGELTLESILQQAFPADHYALQHAFADGDKVDAVVRLPGGMLPIDSKFPLAAFRGLLEATGAEQRQKARRAFARDVRRHIDDIASKYIRPAEGTLDLALMYIPAENVFYEVIAGDPADGAEDDLREYALRRHVTFVSPNSFHAYLQAIAFGLMGLKIEERARDILRRLQQIQGDFLGFQEAFGLGQKHLKNAQTAFTDAQDRAARLGMQIEQCAQAQDAPTPVIPMTQPRGLTR